MRRGGAGEAGGSGSAGAGPGRDGVATPNQEDLDVVHWRRLRRARLTVAAAAPVLALLSPAHRPGLVATALLVYLPVAVLVARHPAQPRAFGAVWWAALGADCAGLALVLAWVPGAESVAFLGFLLVVVVNGATFGARAGVAAAVVAAVASTLGHAGTGAGPSGTDLGVHLGAFALVTALATYIVGRQAEELRAHRRRLEQALAELRRVDELRARLVSTLAHDVRGPLGAIQGSVQTVLRMGGGIDAGTREDLLRGAERQIIRLLRLSNGLLDLARLEEGRLELDLRSVPLRQAVIEALSYPDPEGRIQVEIDPSICVLADAERLDQMVVNLAANMLRHGAAPFAVSARLVEGHVEVTFRDAGPGVPADRVDSLFEPFRSGEGPGSAGFGLSIVRMLAEAHGGSVAYEPNVPVGACFRLRLPGAAAVDGC